MDDLQHPPANCRYYPFPGTTTACGTPESQFSPGAMDHKPSPHIQGQFVPPHPRSALQGSDHRQFLGDGAGHGRISRDAGNGGRTRPPYLSDHLHLPPSRHVRTHSGPCRAAGGRSTHPDIDAVRAAKKLESVVLSRIKLNVPNLTAIQF